MAKYVLGEDEPTAGTEDVPMITREGYNTLGKDEFRDGGGGGPDGGVGRTLTDSPRNSSNQLLISPLENLANISLSHVCRTGDVRLLEKVIKERPRRRLNELDEHLLSPLHVCAKYNHFHCANVLVDHGASVNTVGDNGTTPLHYCAVYRKFKKANPSVPSNLDKISQVLKDEEENQRKLILLFAREASPPCDVNARDRYGSSALHMASYKGNSAAVRDLLQCRADVNCRDGQRATPLMLAASYSFPEIVRILLDNNADHRMQDGEGSTCLHVAVCEKNIAIVEMLLKAAGDSVTEYVKMRNNSSETALHCAVNNNQLEIVKLLLDHGASALEQRTDDLYFPLHLAAQNGEINMLRVIYQAALRDKEVQDSRKVVNVLNKDNQTPLHRAAFFNRVEAINFLIEREAEVDAVESDGFTPLLLAVSKGHSEAIQALIQLSADTVNTDIDQKNVLHHAVETNKTHILKELLSMDGVAELINDQDNFGNSPCHLAARNGNTDMLQVLKSHKADLYLKNEDEQTCLHLASKYGRTRCVRWICSKEDGGDGREMVMDEDENSNTPLHVAAIEGHVNVCRALIASRADVEARNFQQWTPLDCAASHGWVKTARILLENDSPIDPTDRSGVTPLYLACKNGHGAMVQLLLDSGANVEVTASDGRNPLDIAIEAGSTDCVDIIINKPDCWQAALRNRTLRTDGPVHVWETPLRKLIVNMPEQARRIFSKCIKWNTSSAGAEDLELTLNFEFIDDAYSMRTWGRPELRADSETRRALAEIPSDVSPAADKPAAATTVDHISVYDEEGKVEEGARPYSSHADMLVTNHPLTVMVSNEREFLLRHPLVTLLLQQKWRTFGRYVYYINLLQYCVFLVSLTGFIVVTKPRHFWKAENATVAAAWTLREYVDSPDSPVDPGSFFAFHTLGKWVILVTALINLLREVFQAARKRLAYFHVNNVMELVLFSTALVLVLPNCFGIFSPIEDPPGELVWQCGSLAIFLTWIDLILFIQKLPKFGIYVVMFTDVLQTFLQFFVVFILFIVAFALGFFSLLQNQEAFSTVEYSMLKTMIMMIGEFDYTDIFFVAEAEGGPRGLWLFSSMTFFSVFTIIMSIITMNLLVGLAVDDIKAVQDNATLQRMAMQISLALEVEQTLPEFIRKKFIVREQKVQPNKDRFMKAILGNEMDGSKLIRDLEARREPIDDVSLKQDRLLLMMKELTQSVRSLKKEQELLQRNVNKLAAASEVQVDDDDYAGDINDDED